MPLRTFPMRLTGLFLVAILFLSCQHKNHRQLLAKKYLAKIQQEGFTEFLKVEFGTRGNKDIWTYSLNSMYDSTYVWTHDLKNKTFDLTTHPNFIYFKKEVDNPLEFAKKLDYVKNKLGVIAVSNSPWPGHFVKFWFSSSEALIYLPEGFNSDTDSKTIWLEEMKKGIRLDKNWVYLDITKLD